MNRHALLNPRIDAAVFNEVTASLARTPKELPCKLFYDERGAALFEQICTLPEYYPTRAELEILHEHGDEMASWIGPHARIVEFGSGSGDKTRVLLHRLESPVEYVPIDIAGQQLMTFAHELAADLPDIRITPVMADYTSGVPLTPTDQRTVVFFPGSTIGNFEPHAAASFLRHARAIAGTHGGLLIGVDLQKDRTTLERAYNDAAGITAAFNLNILAHINRICNANFDVEAFTHRAVYNELHGRIEMHLVSNRAQVVSLGRSHAHGFHIALAEGERIVTEYSYKYTVAGFRAMATEAGFKPAAVWTDTHHRFSVHAFDVT